MKMGGKNREKRKKTPENLKPLLLKSDGCALSRQGGLGGKAAGRGGGAPGLISQLKPLIVMLYHLDNYRCSKITAQQTVKLYLW